MNKLLKLWSLVLVQIFLITSLSFSIAAETISYELAYDENGNLRQGFGHYFVYDDLNRLAEVRAGGPQEQIIEAYFYDDQNVRLAKFNYLLNETTFYISEDFIQVVNETGVYNSTYYHDGETLVARKDPGDVMYYYHPDHLGSTDVITDQNKDLVELTTYKPYGQVIDGGQSSDFLYTGKEQDDTGLMYYGARYYDPFFRHFTQPDQNIPDVYDPQDLNRYAYVRNNPYRYVDPTGEIPVDIIVDVAFIAYGAYRFARDPSFRTAGELGADIGFAVVPYVPNVKRLAEAGKALDKAKDVAKGGEKVGDVARGADRAGDVRDIESGRNLPDFYGTSNQQIVPSRTPAGREITPHAAERMANPPSGRDVMTPSEADRVIRQSTTTKINTGRQTTTHSAPHLAGKPKVVTSNTRFGRIVTAIKNKFKSRGRR